MNPKSLRRIAAVLLFLAGVTSIALPFISATALALSIGVIAAVAGVTQLLRLGQAKDTKGKVFRGLSGLFYGCLLYTSTSPRDKRQSRMPSSA